jgi:hypothetical protein
MTRHDEVLAAAQVAMAGMDPMRFLESIDPFEAGVMYAITLRFHEEQEKYDLNRATMIANAVARMLGAK